VRLHGRIVLKGGRDGPVRGGNPWIFSQAIARAEPPDLAAGDGVDVCDAAGDSLGFGYYNPGTTIAIRMLAFDHSVAPPDIIGHRLEQAIAIRDRVIRSDTNCYRLINGDGDGLSGIVADRYDDVIVLQILTAGAERIRDELIECMRQRLAPRAIFERSQGAVRREEGLADRVGALIGGPPGEIDVRENGLRLIVDLEQGQKSGYFLDQRENRRRVQQIADGGRVLDAYCYAGGFTLAALAVGAREAVAIDTSVRALGWARRNLELNGCSGRVELIHDEAFNYLAADHGKFDVVVIDPPPLARSAKDVARAGHLYATLNTLAMRAVAPGGWLMTFSCSAHFAGEDFLRAVRIAQSRARRNFRLIERLGPGPDHPVMLGHAEGEYLTGLLLAEIS
jgi:23S rRNA (cytosine1962-C5)-methyltransferase